MKFTEASLEQAVIELFKSEDYQPKNGMHIHKEMSDVLLRDDIKVFLRNRYSNDEITENEIESIIRQMEVLPSSTLYDSNKAIIKMISDGFTFKREDRSKKDLFIQLIDFKTLKNNLFKVVNQLEIQGYEKRIPDGIVYVNGLPLVVLEFKSAIKENTTIKDAFTQLTVRYRRDIPELFKYNAFCVISDGVNNKVGSLFAPYDFFYAWRKIEGNEPLERDGIDSLFTMIKGLFNQKRLLDVVRNFIYFPDTSTQEGKIVPRYPQYYAANKLFESIKRNMKPHGTGKGGTYFGATGCGKSFTMLYLTRLLMRSVHLQSPTIVLITDRTDLDDQLSAQFTNAKGFIGDDQVISVESRAELKNYLQSRKSGGVFLTTIHKFNEDIDLLTDRTNVICISDEAHRSQINLDQKIKLTKDGVEKKYGFAKYLHDSLPNATYVGFTGTPIDATMDVFGEVEDSYTMKESVYDEITVRIVYEGRAAKVNLNEAKLKEIEDYYKKCEADGANEHQIEESKRAVTQMDVILGDPKRLKLVASDFVEHYEKRIEEGATVKGKTMFVASSRPIAYELYKQILALRPHWAEIRECDEGVELSEKERQEIKPIEKIKMVMTRNRDDIKDLYDLLGTKDYRKELDRQYKNEKSNFKIAIVVDMWLTGFDVPFLDTIYIDKPIQQHSLIQTISRVNRVYEGKEMGLVVDYIGIKSNMNVALKKYGVVGGENFDGTEKAVVIVKDQLDLLARIFHKFDSTAYFKGTSLQQLQCLNQAAEFAQQTDELEKRFMTIVKKLRSAYNLCCSSEDISQIERDYIHFYFAIKSIIHKLTVGEAPDTAQMNEKVRQMIQEALISEGVEEIFKLDKNDPKNNADLFSDEYMEKIDKIKLPNTKIKLLQKLLAKAIGEFKKTNRIQGIDFSKRLKKLIEIYNERKDFQAMQSDVLDDVADQFADLFAELVKERNSFEGLGIDFEEKAFYDILKAISEKYEFEYAHDRLINLSQEIKKIVDHKSKYTDWSNRDDIKAELKVDLILALAENGYPPVPRDEIFKEIFEQAENFKKYIVN
ncbi:MULTISPECIES: type I restriction endonuclease subunit R [Bacillus]|uniref:type I restriction endonuclease subunit R n=1 Tax=Bacillus TaxID=1386 RepID=UPI0010A51B9A|nr:MULTISPECIES: type I restriction endonuclease subunit R [Bacillus]MDA4081886.1 type I restriction endonuclease subunit R [Bacillus cereus]QCC39252.1 type I restriction endonuclease [Bacillus sp. DU-106]